MVNRGLAIFFILIIGMLGACQNQEDDRSTTSDPNMDLTKVKTEKPVDQTLANQAKEKIIKREDVKGVRAINTKKDLLLAIDVPQFDRFRLTKIEKEVKKTLKKEFSSVKTNVSTDQKIYMELDKLEKRLQDDDLTKKKAAKKLKRLKELMNEQT